MKMIQTLGYRVGICSVWHPRFKSVHKHRKCINVLFLLRTSTSQRSTRRRCTSATSTNCVTCICRRRTTQVQQNQSLVDTSRTCDKRQADALWAVCLQRPRSPCCYTGSCCTGTSVLWRSSCIILLRPSGTARRDSAGKSSTTSTRGRWGRDTVSVEVTSCFINVNVKLA